MPEKPEPVLAALIGGGVARSLLLAIGGYAVARGWVTQPDVEAAVGALLIIGGIGWSIVQKIRTVKP